MSRIEASADEIEWDRRDRIHRLTFSTTQSIIGLRETSARCHTDLCGEGETTRVMRITRITRLTRIHRLAARSASTRSWVMGSDR